MGWESALASLPEATATRSRNEVQTIKQCLEAWCPSLFDIDGHNGELKYKSRPDVFVLTYFAGLSGMHDGEANYAIRRECRARQLTSVLERQIVAVTEPDIGEDGFSWLHDSGSVYERFVFRIS